MDPTTATHRRRPAPELTPFGAAWARLTRSTFPPALFRWNRLRLMRLPSVRRCASAPLDLPVRWGSTAEGARLHPLFSPADEYERRLAGGSWPVVAEVAGRPAAMLWFDPRPVHDSTANAYRFEIGAGAVWVHGVVVLAQFRGRGVFRRLWAGAAGLLRERGVERVYGAFQADVPHSIAAHRSVGFEPLVDFAVLRVAGLSLYRVGAAPGAPGAVAARLPARWGVGRWRGADPLPPPAEFPSPAPSGESAAAAASAAVESVSK